MPIKNIKFFIIKGDRLITENEVLKLMNILNFLKIYYTFKKSNIILTILLWLI